MKKGSCVVESERDTAEDGDLANLFSIVMSFLLLFVSRAHCAAGPKQNTFANVCARRTYYKLLLLLSSLLWGAIVGHHQDRILFPEVQLLLPKAEFYARINYVNYIACILSCQTQLK
jgi:hypothetical protein